MKGKNQEGYSDPAASMAVGAVYKEEHKADKRAYDLVKVLKYIVRASGFELLITQAIVSAQTAEQRSQQTYRRITAHIAVQEWMR